MSALNIAETAALSIVLPVNAPVESYSKIASAGAPPAAKSPR
eukprot:CAMPEP_0182898552 /NCGR_PEP_ID=MMETSP0034_2-20130328/27555_1 /TAXON_ID=156128 /ORGANISM="Nephroselmis pyriformis, Strain CCMP717" /LENGTH=41 /DNA_ID= /DNA_START= /DNA_END= /DNA_ORIENTATION=